MTNIVNLLPPVQMMNIVIPPPLVSEISIWGIIYIYTRAQVQTETQFLTYGVVRARFLTQIFSVLVCTLTTAPTFCVCVVCCWFFCWFGFSWRKERNNCPPHSPTILHIPPLSADCYAHLCALLVIFMLNRSSDDQNASICILAIAGSECRHMFASLTNN